MEELLYRKQPFLPAFCSGIYFTIARLHNCQNMWIFWGWFLFFQVLNLPFGIHWDISRFLLWNRFFLDLQIPHIQVMKIISNSFYLVLSCCHSFLLTWRCWRILNLSNVLMLKKHWQIWVWAILSNAETQGILGFFCGESGGIRAMFSHLFFSQSQLGSPKKSAKFHESISGWWFSNHGKVIGKSWENMEKYWLMVFQTLFSQKKQGCHPSHWRSPSFFKMGTLHHQPDLLT